MAYHSDEQAAGVIDTGLGIPATGAGMLPTDQGQTANSGLISWGDTNQLQSTSVAGSGPLTEALTKRLNNLQTHPSSPVQDFKVYTMTCAAGDLVVIGINSAVKYTVLMGHDYMMDENGIHTYVQGRLATEINERQKQAIAGVPGVWRGCLTRLSPEQMPGTPEEAKALAEAFVQQIIADLHAEQNNVKFRSGQHQAQELLAIRDADGKMVTGVLRVQHDSSAVVSIQQRTGIGHVPYHHKALCLGFNIVPPARSGMLDQSNALAMLNNSGGSRYGWAAGFVEVVPTNIMPSPLNGLTRVEASFMPKVTLTNLWASQASLPAVWAIMSAFFLYAVDATYRGAQLALRGMEDGNIGRLRRRPSAPNLLGEQLKPADFEQMLANQGRVKDTETGNDIYLLTGDGRCQASILIDGGNATLPMAFLNSMIPGGWQMTAEAIETLVNAFSNETGRVDQTALRFGEVSQRPLCYTSHSTSASRLQTVPTILNTIGVGSGEQLELQQMAALTRAAYDQDDVRNIVGIARSRNPSLTATGTGIELAITPAMLGLMGTIAQLMNVDASGVALPAMQFYSAPTALDLVPSTNFMGGLTGWSGTVPGSTNTRLVY